MTAPRALQRRPPRLRHPGTVETADLWLPADARDRVLSLWQPGARLFQAAGGWLLRLPASQRWHGSRCPGLPLRSVDGRLTSAPMHRRDLTAAPQGALLRLHHGGLAVAPRDEWVPVDPSAWLDLALPPVADVRPLGPPPAPAVIVAAPVATSARRTLGIGEGGAGVVGELAAALARGGLGAAAGLGMAAGLGAQAAGLFGRAIFGLGGLLGALGGGGGAGGGGGPAGGGGLPVPAEPGLLDRWAAQLSALGQRLGLRSALARLMSPQYARYLEQMLEKLDSALSGGDILDALRHAIPLSSVPGSDGGGLGWPGWLRPRGGLDLSRGGATRATMEASPGLFDHLQALYRRILERLKRDERWKEAAYVLAELLGEPAEAVALLEEHGLYREAAEIAEAKELDAALVCLLWLRAGEVERALAMAALHQNWAALVTGLERRELWEQAWQARRDWALTEARAGRPASAFDVAWPVEALRPLARRWLGEAMAAGGIAGADALAEAATLDDAEVEPLRAVVGQLMAETGASGRATRRRAVEQLSANLVDGPNRRLRTLLLKPLLRAVLADVVDDPHHRGQTAFRAAIGHVDPGLSADLPPLPSQRESQQVRKRSAPLLVTATATDRGTRPVLDAALAWRDRILVALGEEGAVLLSPDGRRLRAWAHPAHAIVMAWSGTSAVLVGQRGMVQRLTRLDLRTGAAERWCDAQLDTWARSHDGSIWFVAQQDRVLGLDPHARGLRALWSVGDLAPRDLAGRADRRVLALQAEKDHFMAVVAAGPDAVEHYAWARSGPRMHSRRTVQLGGDRVIGASWYGPLLARPHGAAEDRGSVVSTLPLAAVPGATGVAETTAAAWHGLATAGMLGTVPAAVLFESHERADARLLLRVDHPGAGRLGQRLAGTPDNDGERLLSWDDQGRVRLVDLLDGAVVADLRL